MPPQNTCAVIASGSISPRSICSIQSVLRREIRRAVDEGYTHFIVRLEPGLDLFCGALLATLQESGEPITIEALLRCRERIHCRDPLFSAALLRCSAVGIADIEKQASGFQQTARLLVEYCGRIIAVHEENDRTEVARILRRAKRMGREIRVIAPGNG